MRILLSLGLALLVGISPLHGAKKQPTRIACVGNSVTFGYGIEHPEDNSYPAQLQTMLGNSYLVANFGHSGATLLSKGHRPYIEQEAYKKALDFDADIAIIHLGLNDTDPRNWPNHRDHFIGDYLRLIETFRKRNPKIRIIIARMSPILPSHPRFASSTRLWYQQIQGAIEQVSRLAEVELVDFQRPLYSLPHLLPDAIHPTKEGATKLAELAYSQITGDYGGLSLAPLYTDGMVLQLSDSIALSGRANEGEEVELRFAGQRIRTKARGGRWQAYIDGKALGTNYGPYTLELRTKQKRITIKDVLVGEVWLASGQSNMAYTMNQTDGKERAERANDPFLRLYDMKPRWQTDDHPWTKSALDSVDRGLYFSQPRWQPSTTADVVGNFSSIAYSFAEQLRDSLQRPVGIICNALGGSNLESWIPRDLLEEHYPEMLKSWRTSDYLMDWVRGRIKRNTELRPTARHPYEPSYLYETGIQRLEHYPIKGVIWYQGESNAHNVELHEQLFPLFVEGWQRELSTRASGKHLPIYFAQLSSINRPSWGHFRHSQARLAELLPSVYMVVTSDHGHPSDVHPRNKQILGYRLALQALRHSYDRKGFATEGPSKLQFITKDKEVLAWFEQNSAGLHTSDGKEALGWELADESGIFYPSKAILLGDGRILLSSPQVSQPKRVRYGYQAYSLGNLVNGAGLPASTTEGIPSKAR